MDARTRAGLERAMTALSSDLAGHFEDQRPESAGPPVQLGPGPIWLSSSRPDIPARTNWLASMWSIGTCDAGLPPQMVGACQRPSEAAAAVPPAASLIHLASHCQPG